MASRSRATGEAPVASARTRKLPDLRSTRLRALIERPTLSAALLLGLFVLAYLWPVLLAGDMLAPLTVLYMFAPWRGVAPPDVAAYFNPLLSDIAFSHYPWNVFARELIHAGTFPAWNPHQLTGVPFFANPQTVLLSPFSLPMWILPLNYGLGVAAALKLWAAAFGTYLLARELRLGFLPGLLAGVAYSLSAFHVVWLAHESLPAVSALLPWMLLLAERTLRRDTLWAPIGLAVATGVALTGGHPGTQLHVLAATAVYAAIRAGTVAELAATVRLRRLGLVAVALVLGMMLVGVMFVPELKSSIGTLGTQSRHGGHGTQPGVDMPIQAIRTVLFPDWWGRPSAFESTDPLAYTLNVNFNERTFYAGAVALLFAVIGLVSRGGWRRKAPLLVLGAVALAIPLDAPVLGWLTDNLPGFGVVQNQRMHFVFALAVAVLAAFGLDTVLRRPRGERWQLLAPVAGVVVALLAISAIGPSGQEIGRAVEHFVTGADFRSLPVLSLTSVGWWLLFTLAVGAALLALRRWPQRAAVIGALVVVVAAVDMLHFAHGFQPMAPPSKMIPPKTPAIAYLQQRADEGRFTGLMYTLPQDWSGTYGLSDVRGYDPPQPTLRYWNLWRIASPTQLDWQPFAIPGLDAAGLNVLSVLGTRYVIAEPGLDAPEGAQPAYRALTRVYAASDATIFRNDRAVPRAMVAPAIELTGDEDETRAAIADETFDPRRAVVVERGEPGATALASAPPASGTVGIAHEENARVTLRATLDRRGLVVLNDQLTDGWSVEVDGRPAEIVRVNSVMRGVAVDGGEHEVTWSYAVPGLRLGLALTLIAVILLAAAAAACAMRGRGPAADEHPPVRPPRP